MMVMTVMIMDGIGDENGELWDDDGDIDNG